MSDKELERLRARVAELERDRAEHARVEDELRAVNAKLCALLENTDDFILFSDRNGSPLFFNTNYARVMKALLGIDMRPGLKPHELLEDEQERAAWEDHHRRVLSGEKFTVEYAHPLEDGSARHFEVRYNPVRQDGEIIGFSEFTSDVTKHKLAEQALRESNAKLERLAAERRAELHITEARYRALTEHSTDLIAILDPDRRFTYISPSIRRYGFEPHQVVGRTASDFVVAEDYPRVARAIDQAVARPGKQVSIDVFRANDASGELVELEGQVACLFGVSGINGIVFNGRDITERRRLEERLRHAEKMDAIGQLAGGVAHDFNNQLTGILAGADLLRRQLGDSPCVRFADQIIHAAERSADLTRKLLTFARRGAVQREPTDLNYVVSELVELLERSVDKGITIEVDLSDARCTTVGDPTLIHNAILNLALNARDAMPSGGRLCLATSLVILDVNSVSRLGLEIAPGPYVKVTVSDNGEGMDEETQRRIFEPFFTTKQPGKGTGMGLASVYGTAERHQGAVVVRSRKHEGTTVDLYLPADNSVAAVVRNQAHHDDQHRARILVVDDEQALRDVLADLLASLGHEVRTCADGVEAVDIFREAPDAFDLVVLDMIMPRMGGRETLLALQEIDPDVRTLVISGFSDDGVAQQLVADGARGFLHKPFDVDGISRAIQLAQRPSAA